MKARNRSTNVLHKPIVKLVIAFFIFGAVFLLLQAITPAKTAYACGVVGGYSECGTYYNPIAHTFTDYSCRAGEGPADNDTLNNVTPWNYNGYHYEMFVFVLGAYENTGQGSDYNLDGLIVNSQNCNGSGVAGDDVNPSAGQMAEGHGTNNGAIPAGLWLGAENMGGYNNGGGVMNPTRAINGTSPNDNPPVHQYNWATGAALVDSGGAFVIGGGVPGYFGDHQIWCQAISSSGFNTNPDCPVYAPNLQNGNGSGWMQTPNNCGLSNPAFAPGSFGLPPNLDGFGTPFQPQCSDFRNFSWVNPAFRASQDLTQATGLNVAGQLPDFPVHTEAEATYTTSANTFGAQTYTEVKYPILDYNAAYSCSGESYTITDPLYPTYAGADPIVTFDFSQPGLSPVTETSTGLSGSVPMPAGFSNPTIISGVWLDGVDFWGGKTLTCASPPTVTITSTTATACSNSQVTGTATGTDPITATYTIDGGPSQAISNAHAFSIDMSGYDQLAPHNVVVTESNVAGSDTQSMTYGPCYTPTCGTTTVPGVIPAGSGAFSASVTLKFTPENGAPGVPPGPGLIHGTLTISFPGQASQSFTNTGTGTASFNAPPTAGPTYAISWTFKDPGPPAAPAPVPLTCGGGIGHPDSGGNCTIDCGNFIVVYVPYLNANGDVVAGSKFSNNACTNSSANKPSIIGWNTDTSPYKGAGTPFAAYALGYIDGFATGQGTATNVGDGLSFTNTNNNSPSSDTFGGLFDVAPCATDYYALMPSVSSMTSVSATPNLSALFSAPPSASPNYFSNSSITIPSATVVPKNLEPTIYVNGNVTINGNITYADASGGAPADWNSFSEIPKLKIVACGNITISPSVTELDGIYVAEPAANCPGSPSSQGAIHTCNYVSNWYNTCDTQLVVNGAFVSSEVFYERSCGNLYSSTNAAACNGDVGGPAEVFNYSPELWLSGADTPNVISPFTVGPCSKTTSSCYDSITSLPPIL